MLTLNRMQNMMVGRETSAETNNKNVGQIKPAKNGSLLKLKHKKLIEYSSP